MNKQIAIYIALIILGSSFVLADITCSETMTRTAPSIVNPGSTFTVKYTAIGASGSWGATILDTVSGGCQFPAGTELKTVMLNDEGNVKTVQVTAPSSGSCTFTGDYMFGECSISNFLDIAIDTTIDTEITIDGKSSMWWMLVAIVIFLVIIATRKK